MVKQENEFFLASAIAVCAALDAALTAAKTIKEEYGGGK